MLVRSTRLNHVKQNPSVPSNRGLLVFFNWFFSCAKACKEGWGSGTSGLCYDTFYFGDVVWINIISSFDGDGLFACLFVTPATEHAQQKQKQPSPQVWTRICNSSPLCLFQGLKLGLHRPLFTSRSGTRYSDG